MEITRQELKCHNCGRWNEWKTTIHPDCECGDARYTGSEKEEPYTKEKVEEIAEDLEN